MSDDRSVGVLSHGVVNTSCHRATYVVMDS